MLYKICYESTDGKTFPTTDEAIIYSILDKTDTYLSDGVKERIAKAFIEHAYIIERKQSEVIPVSQSSDQLKAESFNIAIRPTKDREDAPRRDCGTVQGTQQDSVD